MDDDLRLTAVTEVFVIEDPVERARVEALQGLGRVLGFGVFVYSDKVEVVWGPLGRGGGHGRAVSEGSLHSRALTRALMVAVAATAEIEKENAIIEVARGLGLTMTWNDKWVEVAWGDGWAADFFTRHPCVRTLRQHDGNRYRDMRRTLHSAVIALVSSAKSYRFWARRYGELRLGEGVENDAV